MSVERCSVGPPPLGHGVTPLNVALKVKAPSPIETTVGSATVGVGVGVDWGGTVGWDVGCALGRAPVGPALRQGPPRSVACGLAAKPLGRAVADVGTDRPRRGARPPSGALARAPSGCVRAAR